MKFKNHPLLSELSCNEDGTVIKWNGKTLIIKEYELKNRCKQRRVNFKGATHTVTKIICECWNEQRDRMDQKIKRHDGDCNNDHYTNLFWGDPGRQHTERSKLSKIMICDIPTIEKRLKKGDTLKAIAKDYGVSDMSISRIKKKMK